MKVNISRITEAIEDYKPRESIVLDVYKERDNFICYELDNKTTERKLVFKNVNHMSMLHKHLMFEHFYVILFVVIVVCILSLFSNSYLMQLVALAGILYVPYKLISASEIPYKLVFDGLNIYELNHLGKRIIEFNPDIVESSDSDKYENDFIFMSNTSKRGKDKMKSIVFMIDNELKIRNLLIKHLNNFNFSTSIK